MARPKAARSVTGLLILLAPALLSSFALAAEETTTPHSPVGTKTWRKGWSWSVLDEKGLALGGGGLGPDDVADLKARGFEAILNYRSEHAIERAYVEAEGLEYLWINSTFAESDMMPVEEVEAAVAFIEENLAAGRPVYVHCTGGLHRSLVGPAAYFMKTRGWRADEALAHIEKLRPEVMPWFSEALYLYEQRLYGGPKLTVDLWTDRWDLARNETVNVTASVTRNGAPVAGASVEFVAETGKEITTTRVTGSDGLARFTFTSAASPNVQYARATARLEGSVAGYDRNVYWVGKPKPALPTVLHVEAPPPVEPGAPFTLRVRTTESDGGSTNTRISVTTACDTLHREFTGWDGRDEIALRAPERPGTYTLLVRAVRFSGEPAAQEVKLVVGAGGPEPPCGLGPVDVTPEPTPSPRGPSPATPTLAMPPTTPDLAPEASVRGTPGAPLAALLAALGALALGRRHTR